jgi:hypothetical protein
LRSLSGLVRQSSISSLNSNCLPYVFIKCLNYFTLPLIRVYMSLPSIISDLSQMKCMNISSISIESQFSNKVIMNFSSFKSDYMSLPCLCYSKKVSLPNLDPRDRFSLRTRCPNVDLGWYPVLASSNPGLCMLHLDFGAHLAKIESCLLSNSSSNLLRLLE